MQTVLTQTILDKIVRQKYADVERSKHKVSLEIIRGRAAHAPQPRNFMGALQVPGVQLIAEVKRASPSKGVLQQDLDSVTFATCYAANGAAAISVLTDQPFFKGSLDDLKAVKQAVSLPVLRKDFVFDPYQVYEARAVGADAILLIAAILKDKVMRELYLLINDLGMSALVEVHNADEVNRVLKLSPQIVGINNRDLNTFEVNLGTSENLIPQLPGSVVKVAESGIHTATDIKRLYSIGVDAVLVGESIVTAPNIGAKVRELSSYGQYTSDQD